MIKLTSTGSASAQNTRFSVDPRPSRRSSLVLQPWRHARIVTRAPRALFAPSSTPTRRRHGCFQSVRLSVQQRAAESARASARACCASARAASLARVPWQLVLALADEPTMNAAKAALRSDELNDAYCATFASTPNSSSSSHVDLITCVRKCITVSHQWPFPPESSRANRPRRKMQAAPAQNHHQQNATATRQQRGTSLLRRVAEHGVPIIGRVGPSGRRAGRDACARCVAQPCSRECETRECQLTRQSN